MAEQFVDIHRPIVEQAIAGSRAAQFELYRLYSKAMYNICYRMLNNKTEAEDLLQEAFCEAFRQINAFRFDSTIGAWLKRITINRCINHIKKRRVSIGYIENYDKIQVAEETPSGEEEERVKYTVEKIHRAMVELPEGSRIVFSLYLLEGYDHTEISEILNISESTSKTQLMRAKQKVKEIVLRLQ